MEGEGEEKRVGRLQIKKKMRKRSSYRRNRRKRIRISIGRGIWGRRGRWGRRKDEGEVVI